MPRKSLFLDLAAFFLPVLMLVEFQLVGQLFLGEILIISFIPLVISRLRFYYSSEHARLLVLLYLFWTFSLILSDLYRQSLFIDFSRGWSKQAFTLSNTLMFLFLFGRSHKRISLALGGLGVFYMISGFQTFDDIPQIWKFGAGSGLALFTMTIFSYIGLTRSPLAHILLSAALLFGFGVISFFLNSRSGAGMFLIASFALCVLLLVQKFSIFSLRNINLTKLSISGIVLALLFLSLYNTGASSGFFGEEARAKYEKQFVQGYGPFGILIGGRTEILVALNAIKDSPIIGHGSWARDVEYRYMLLDIRKQLNNEILNVEEYFQEDDYIPSHSHLLGAWVQAGFAGAAFWFFVLILFMRLIRNWNVVPLQLKPTIIYLIVWASWDIMFSPFGGERRLFWGILLAILVRLLVNVNESRPRKRRKLRRQKVLA